MEVNSATACTLVSRRQGNRHHITRSPLQGFQAYQSSPHKSRLSARFVIHTRPNHLVLSLQVGTICSEGRVTERKRFGSHSPDICDKPHCIVSGVGPVRSFLCHYLGFLHNQPQVLDPFCGLRERKLWKKISDHVEQREKNV